MAEKSLCPECERVRELGECAMCGNKMCAECVEECPVCDEITAKHEEYAETPWWEWDEDVEDWP